MKKDCWLLGAVEALNCKYYDEFIKFRNAIDDSLNKIANGLVKKELDSLLSLKFQLFDNSIYCRA
jgi:hypothetical protein